MRRERLARGMDTATRWRLRGGEAVAAAMLAGIFVTFVLQIVARYVVAQPPRWTLELCLVLWIWLIFWGCAFAVRERDHVALDLVCRALPERVRRILALVSAAAITVALGASLAPTLDWINFLQIKKSPSLHLSMRTIYAIYAVFLVVVLFRYALKLVRLARGAPATERDERGSAPGPAPGSAPGSAPGELP